MSVSLQANGAPVARGGQLVDYTLVVGNAGPSEATGVVVSLSPTNLTAAQVSGACDSLPCMITRLGAGSKASIYVHTTVAADGPFILAAAVKPRQLDPDTSNNTAEVRVEPPPVAGPADVSLSIRPSGQPVARANQGVGFWLVIGNAGPSAATGLAVNVAAGNLANPQVSGACDRLPCTIASLGPGVSASVLLHQTVVADGAFSLQAEAVSGQTDPDPSNNGAQVTVEPVSTGRDGDDPTPGDGLWWLIGGVGLLVAGLGTKAVIDARTRARWLRQLSVRAERGSEDAFAPGPLTFVAPSVGITVRCEAGEAAPCGAVPILEVASDG